jgi:hypothetical protein
MWVNDTMSGHGSVWIAMQHLDHVPVGFSEVSKSAECLELESFLG